MKGVGGSNSVDTSTRSESIERTAKGVDFKVAEEITLIVSPGVTVA